MSASSDQISIFSNFNPICEGFVITDIDINTYKGNPNHFFHRVLFSAFNTTRYNTISFKAISIKPKKWIGKDIVKKLNRGHPQWTC